MIYKMSLKNKILQKMPLRRNFRPTPLLGCRGCSRGQGCVQGGPGVVSVTGSSTVGGVFTCSGGPSTGAWSFYRGVSLLSGIRGVLDWGLVVLLCGRRGAGLYRRESFLFICLGFQSKHHLIIVKVLQQLLDRRSVGFHQGMIILG